MWESDGAAPATITIHGAAGAPPRVIEVAATAHAEVVVDGLAAGARYRYEVKLGDRVAKGELTTAPPPGAPVPLTFVVYGDTRSSSDAHRQLVERIRAEVPDFLLGTGDLVDDGAIKGQWQTFFDVEGPLLADNVFYPAHSATTIARAARARPRPTARGSRCPRAAPIPSGSTRSPTGRRGSSSSTPTRRRSR